MFSLDMFPEISKQKHLKMQYGGYTLSKQTSFITENINAHTHTQLCGAWILFSSPIFSADDPFFLVKILQSPHVGETYDALRYSEFGDLCLFQVARFPGFGV